MTIPLHNPGGGHSARRQAEGLPPNVYREALRKKGRPLFVPFTVLGDPDREQSLQIIRTLVDSGADALELGLPFSDPPADGPVIQAADSRALKAGITIDETRPRVVMQFSANANDMLLSGTLANGQFLANRAAALDHPIGKGHIVMFAIRPFWRWQTQGTYTLGFNAIMNWNDLDAGKQQAAGRGTASPER